MFDVYVQFASVVGPVMKNTRGRKPLEILVLRFSWFM